MTAQAAVACRGLQKRYGDVVAVAGLDLDVRSGECFGLLGPNGAGKTTTIRILTGLLDRFEGEVRVAGLDVKTSALEVKARIGYVPENAQLYDALSMEEVVQQGLHKTLLWIVDSVTVICTAVQEEYFLAPTQVRLQRAAPRRKLAKTA